MSEFQRKILIVGDNAEQREELRQMILSGSDQACEFADAELGETALALMQKYGDDHYDCILLKYDLPDMDAEQMLAAICDQPDFPPCPIVVLTGADQQVGKRLLRGGAQDYLGKAWLTPESLARAIDNAIERFAMLLARRKSEQALRESEEKFRLLVDVCETLLSFNLKTKKPMQLGTCWFPSASAYCSTRLSICIELRFT